MPPYLSVSTWSLHRALGPIYRDTPEKPDRAPQYPYGEGTLDLLELPRKLAQRGIRNLEICHFHLSSLDDAYLHEVCGALSGAGVTLFSLLIDDGDITHPEHGGRDQAWIAGWLEVAGKVGAKNARVIAGKSTGAGSLARSKAALQDLMTVAEANGVGLMTENWFDLLSTPAAVETVFEGTDGHLGLCFDFGNWRGADKYEKLGAIAPYARSCHAKCSFDAGFQPDRADYERCLDLTQAAGFNGPYTLVYDGPDDDEWAGLQVEIEMVRPYLI